MRLNSNEFLPHELRIKSLGSLVIFDNFSCQDESGPSKFLNQDKIRGAYGIP